MDVKKIEVTFKLKRQRKINKLMDYVMLVAFTIITGISIIYIPYVGAVRDIDVAQSVNNNLRNQLEVLQNESVPGQSVSALERNYDTAFKTLQSVEVDVHERFNDIHSAAFEGIEIVSIVMNAQTKTFNLVVLATQEADLSKFNSDILENFGVVPGVSLQERWVTDSRASADIRKSGGVFRTEILITYA